MRLLRVHTDAGLRDAVLTEDGRVATLADAAEAFDPDRWRERAAGAEVETLDEVPDPQAIKLGLDVNGDVLQDSSTAQMIFSVAHLVHYLSQFMTLYPGDVISTGTPAGVGAGQKPPRFLRAGDVLRVWADGLGEQNTRLV